MSETLTPKDISALGERGIELAEVERQLELFRRPTRYAALARPCVVGDGITAIAEADREALAERHDRAAADGRCLKFVPASGAASRMFKDLLYFTRGEGRGTDWDGVRELSGRGHAAAQALMRFHDHVQRFAFHDDLQASLHEDGKQLSDLLREGRVDAVLDRLLGTPGLGYASRPKGLLKFHRYDEGARTSFEEHLVEGASVVADGDGCCRLHFTVSPDHMAGFQELLESMGPALGERHGVRYEVGFSTQKPSTDTLAVDLDNQPFRSESGSLLFRPGGHGALIENLADLRGDVVFVKNIDNIQPDHAKPTAVLWKKVLCGFLLELQDATFALAARLRDEEATTALIDESQQFLRTRLNVELELPTGDNEACRDRLLDRLYRPLRVCGVVANTGEPGGGPFWVRGDDGVVSLQIVEKAQIDPGSESQQEMLHRSTHFNPVDLVCAVRDDSGRPFDLHDYIDESAVMIATKSAEGRELKALERPGLWNGGMARWNTAFVEVPLETFTPVKTVLDLLRPEHQPAD